MAHAWELTMMRCAVAGRWALGLMRTPSPVWARQCPFTADTVTWICGRPLPQVDAGFDEHAIPYDVIWLDIEHTNGKR